MKAPLILLVMLIGIFNLANAQEKKVDQKHVPKLVYKAFGDEYPDATKVEWTVPECDCYEDWEQQWEEGLEIAKLPASAQPKFFNVNFKYDNKEKRSIYYRNGEWIETRTVLNKSSIPPPISTTLNKSEYHDWKLGDKIVFVQKNGEDREAYYKVPLKQGMKRKTLRFDFEGAMISEKEAKKEIPKVVYKAFGDKYPYANEVEWYVPDCDCYEDWKAHWEQVMTGEVSGMEDPDNFHVKFQYKDKSQKSIFYRNGAWVQTEIVMNSSDLPGHILQAIKSSQYSTWDMPDQVVLVETPQDDGQMEAIYNVVMKGGLKRHKLKIYGDGTLVPKKALLGGDN